MIEMKQLKQKLLLVTITVRHKGRHSIHWSGIPIKNIKTSTVATVSFTRPSGKWLLWKNRKLTRNAFLSLSIDRNEDKTVDKFVLSWWVDVWVKCMVIGSLSGRWLSDRWAAGSISHKLQEPIKLIEVCLTSIEQVGWSLHGVQWVFTGSANNFPIPVDTVDFCKGFRLGGNTRNKIYIGLDDLVINEVHHIIEWNCLPEFFFTKIAKNSTSRNQVESNASFEGSLRGFLVLL